MNKKQLKRVVVFGGSGTVGRELVKRFAADGYRVLAIGRELRRLQSLPAEPIVMDVRHTKASDSPVRRNDIVVQATYLQHTKWVASLCPPDIERLVVLGSARHLSTLPDPLAEETRDAIRFLNTVSLPWVALHPTLVYGNVDDESTEQSRRPTGIQRIKHLISRFPAVPLPRFGKALIQPVHVGDVYRLVVEAIENDTVLKTHTNIAGPEPMTMSTFIKLVGWSMGRRVIILPMPLTAMILAAATFRRFPRMPHLGELEIRHLAEDRNVDLTAMKGRFNTAPRPFARTEPPD